MCGPCSSKKFLLPSQSTKPVRVCLDCYDSLSQSKNEQVKFCENQSNFGRQILFNWITALNQTKTGTGNAKSNNNTATADSSAEDDSDDEEEQKEAHDEVSQFILLKWNNNFSQLPNFLLANELFLAYVSAPLSNAWNDYFIAACDISKLRRIHFNHTISSRGRK